MGVNYFSIIGRYVPGLPPSLLLCRAYVSPNISRTTVRPIYFHSRDLLVPTRPTVCITWTYSLCMGVLRHCLHSGSASPKPGKRRKATIIIFDMEQCT